MKSTKPGYLALPMLVGWCLLLITCFLPLTACSRPAATSTDSDQASLSPTAAADGARFLLTNEPAGAMDVIQVRQEAKDQDHVVIRGRIGGSENPWVAGRAAFSIVDPSLKSCAECGSHDCPKPWDYC